MLFVCKLNPITTDEDLEIIFSRFGTIVRYIFLKRIEHFLILFLKYLLSCEIIRDDKSGESLQYAFIEFEKVSLILVTRIFEI